MNGTFGYIPANKQRPMTMYMHALMTEKVKTALQQGKKVLLIPENVKGRKTKFASHFWNPIMFNWNPMIVGTLIDSNHPAFGEFPTTSYADWQWWDILNYATAMELNDLTDITPIHTKYRYL